MKNLTGINIRKGLELEVPLEDIFKITPEAEGEILAMQIYCEGWNNIDSLKNKKYEDVFKGDDAIMYSTKKKVYQVNDTLKAYVKDVYIVSLEEVEDGVLKPSSDKIKEIDFVNTERMDYGRFLVNVMAAQAFTGIHKTEYKNNFVGVGDFSMKEYMESHNLISFSNIHLLDFFVFTDNILSSIGNFFMGNYLKDIEDQKEYFSETEYLKRITDAENHRRLITEELQGLYKGTE